MMHELLKYLTSIPPGQVDDVDRISSLLAACWDEFAGSDEEGMKGYKLVCRMENVSWSPPILRFTIERHGGTVLGSTRAELQEWQVNVERRSAGCDACTYRQLETMRPRLYVKPMAAEIVDLIVTRQKDGRLGWNKDGSVQIKIGKILPKNSVRRQTLDGRRKRFREEVERLLAGKGWRTIHTNVFAPGVG